MSVCARLVCGYVQFTAVSSALCIFRPYVLCICTLYFWGSLCLFSSDWHIQIYGQVFLPLTFAKSYFAPINICQSPASYSGDYGSMVCKSLCIVPYYLQTLAKMEHIKFYANSSISFIFIPGQIGRRTDRYRKFDKPILQIFTANTKKL